MVKGRERCRQLVQFYQRMRAAQATARETPPIDQPSLQEADRILTSALALLRSLPEKPVESCRDPENKAYAKRLLCEVGDLLESALIMDKEIRSGAVARQPACSGVARSAALRCYSGV